MLSFKNEIKIILEKMITKIKDMDEFEYFKYAVLELKSRNLTLFNVIYSSLSETNRSYLHEVLQTKRISIQNDASLTTEARKIVKVKTKKKF